MQAVIIHHHVSFFSSSSPCFIHCVPGWREHRSGGRRGNDCKGIPTIVINAGDSLANEAGFDHYIGANDFNTGKDSGEKMISACPGCERFYCIDHCGGCESWVARCEGFEAAVGEGYGQRIEIDDSSKDAYIASI